MGYEGDRIRQPIQPAEGRLGVLTPGMGAVATTFIAGVEAIKWMQGQTAVDRVDKAVAELAARGLQI